MVLRALRLSVGLLFLLLVVITSAQPNACYPPLDKSRTPKRGKCFYVTHTLAETFAVDTIPILDTTTNDFGLVDRHYASPLYDDNDDCKVTSVMVSTDHDDVDMGNFRREAWAEQAIKLRRGLIHVNYDVIGQNLNGKTTRNKFNKKNNMNNTISEAVFIMYLKCPAPMEMYSDRKNKTRTEFSVAMLYQPPSSQYMSSDPYLAFLQIATAISGLTYENENGFWENAVAPYEPFDPSVWPSSGDRSRKLAEASGLVANVHKPVCSLQDAMPDFLYCLNMKWLQNILFYVNPPKNMYNCKINYPAQVQPNIDESQNLGKDKLGNNLPAAFVDLVDPILGLPEEVDPAIAAQEKATMYWLHDKVQQLYYYAPCTGSGSGPAVPFAIQNQMAPNFGHSTLHYLREVNETNAGSNFTVTPLAFTALGTDAADTQTTVVVVRGTMSRSEWVINAQANQLFVSDETLVTSPILSPFLYTQIHAGYAETFKQIYPAILGNVTDDNPGRIIVTGHSLGAGLATLISYALAIDIPNVQVDAALFAPPSVGDTLFAYKFNRKVNARRVAFVAYREGPNSRPLASFGDVVPQSPCPSTPLCYYKNTSFVSTQPKPSLLRRYAEYTQVRGNVLFDWRSMPTPPPSYNLPANTTQQTWRLKDGVANTVPTHGCSYPCYFSDAVDVKLNRCLFQQNVNQNPGKIPLEVQQYGLCNEPPPELPGKAVYAVNQVYFG